jgi:hypothetical protein
MTSFTKKQLGPITYWQKGNNPELLIHSGTHGDEFSVIEPLTEYIFTNQKNLPDFIFVPEVSPSAVANKTRVNGNGLDLNRSFFDQSEEAEIKANLELINAFSFKKIMSFHEDTEYKEFYLYDSHKINDKAWQNFVNKLKVIGLDVLNGLDDPDDPVLGTNFENGYFSTADLDFSNSNSGTLSEYLAKNKSKTRYFTIEVPTQSELKQKKALIELIFSEL